jgi:hypothetical protein
LKNELGSGVMRIVSVVVVVKGGEFLRGFDEGIA